MAVKRVTGPEDYQLITTDTKPTGVPEGSTCTIYDDTTDLKESQWRYHNGKWRKLN